MRHCTKCGRDLPDDMFYEKRHGNWCKDCVREYSSEYQRKHAKENVERVQKWRREHPEKAREAAQRRAAKNREKIRAYNREYYRKTMEENPEKYWQYQLNTALRHLEKLKKQD